MPINAERAQVIENRLRARLLEADSLDSVLGDLSNDVLAITDAVGFGVGWLSDTDTVIYPRNALTPAALTAFRRIKKGAVHREWTPLREQQLRDMGLLGGPAKSGAFCLIPSFSRPDAELVIVVLEPDAEPRALTTSPQGGRFFWTQFTTNLARLDAVQAEATPFFVQCRDGQDLRQAALSLAKSPDAGIIFLEGESGTGKTTLARWIHNHFDPPRRQGFFEYKCDPSDNVDIFKNKILGVRRGEFTGADRDRAGLVEQWEDGTLFLDNIHKLDARSQEVLLGVLERRAKYVSITNRVQTPVRCKFILASAVELQLLERDNQFSVDLSNRIKPGRIQLRSVRHYSDADLAGILGHLWKLVWRRERISLTPPQLPSGILGVVRQFPLSGNLRQLDSAFEHILRQFAGNTPEAVDPEVYVSKFRQYLPTWERSDPVLDSVLPVDDSRVLTLEEVDRRYARWAFGKCGNKKRTYEALGISHVTLDKLLREDQT